MIGTSASRTLRERAARFLSPALYGGANAQTGNPGLPEGSPHFFARSNGARVWDVDGKEYIDLLSAMGPNLLGYGDPHVEEAARRQRALGDSMIGPASVMVDLAEDLVGMVSHADWALFAKNGVDVTSAAVHIARAHTGKRGVLTARGAYHGAHPWSAPSTHLAGILPGEREHLSEHEFNDIGSLEAAVAAAQGDLAAIVVSAYKHDFGVPQEGLDTGYAQRCRELANETGALLIVDDIRAGFRITRDCSWEVVGVRPDLSCWSQAIANGYPLSALLGSDTIRESSGKVMITGTFWTQAVPMAAARATLERVRTTDYLEHSIAMGILFRAGLDSAAADNGFEMNITGPAQMPMVHFADDPELALAWRFADGMIQTGVYMFPHHHLFMCAALTSADIEATLEKADGVLAGMAKARPARSHREDGA